MAELADAADRTFWRSRIKAADPVPRRDYSEEELRKRGLKRVPKNILFTARKGCRAKAGDKSTDGELIREFCVDGERWCVSERIASTMMTELTPQEDKCLKKVIRMLRDSAAKKDTGPPLDKQDVKWILNRVKTIVMNQPMLVEVTAPISICGDIHGQFVDLMRLYEQNGWPPKTRYLFLGDYVDRGPQNIETICMQFALKIRYPNDFYILRGNHETRDINRIYGFLDEIRDRFNDPMLYEQFNDVFDWMPLAGLVAGRILCMHGGISPELTSLDQIRNLKRPVIKVPDVGLEADLLWADPDKNVNGYVPSSRGISYQFGADTVVDVCEGLNLDMIARAHQVVHDGFEFFAEDRLITLFTAPDYCDQFTNAGGILSVDADLSCQIKQLPSRARARSKK